MPTLIIFLGPAGCGKSSLTANFGRWLEEEMGFKVGYVNLDPAADYLPYKPDFDVRMIVRADEIMAREHLGPNGAIIRCMEIMNERIDEIVENIKSIRADFILCDSSGQMEPFTFRPIGPRLLSELSKLGSTLGVFIVDTLLASSLTGLVIAYMLGVIVQLRLNIPCVTVINKVDLLPEEKRRELEALLTDPVYLESKLSSLKVEGVIADLAYFIGKNIHYFMQASRVVQISATKKLGFDILYDLIHEVFCTCGDLT